MKRPVWSVSKLHRVAAVGVFFLVFGAICVIISGEGRMSGNSL